MVIEKLKRFLDEKKVEYSIIQHSTAYTASEVAEVTHISGKEIAKTVIVNLDGKKVMVALPASYQIDFDLLREAAVARSAELATEEEFRNMFPGCQVGAMPPFGNLYGLDVIIDATLTEDKEIVFNAGTHQELIRMRFYDFQRLVRPRILCLTKASAIF